MRMRESEKILDPRFHASDADARIGKDCGCESERILDPRFHASDADARTGKDSTRPMRMRESFRPRFHASDVHARIERHKTAPWNKGKDERESCKGARGRKQGTRSAVKNAKGRKRTAIEDGEFR